MSAPSDPGDASFVKRRSDAPDGFFAAEAAGLSWLAEARSDGGAAVVDVLSLSRTEIRLRRLATARPTPAAAEAFGRALAVTHRHGAPAHGSAAPGAGGQGWIGPLPLPVRDPDQVTGTTSSWGAFFATDRLQPFLHLAVDRRAIGPDDVRAVRRICDRLAAGDGELTGPEEPPSRLHGDLWSGNVLWTPQGAVLIDPSAHGGHRESDLAMLALFGAPYLDQVLAAYHATWPLAPGWRRRVALHQLFPLLVHAALFGSGYGSRAGAAARRCLTTAGC
ncbi:MAG TPA: fructosamine kinase family protein [Kineosporiaceae bacterium]